MTAGWHTYVADDHPAAMLLTARAIRERCARVMAAAEHGDTPFWRWREERLPDVADYVCATIRERDPTLAVPFHSRWRHFETHGVDRWKAIADAHQLTGTERARTQIDLAVTSVLLDAGAGPRWRYKDATTGEAYSRSEGLALASLGLFAAGAFSADRAKPLRADAAALESLDAAVLTNGFQATVDNPLVGVAERAALLRRLGAVAAATPVVFGSPARLGNLFDY